jgi:hypothetical protein
MMNKELNNADGLWIDNVNCNITGVPEDLPSLLFIPSLSTVTINHVEAYVNESYVNETVEITYTGTQFFPVPNLRFEFYEQDSDIINSLKIMSFTETIVTSIIPPQIMNASIFTLSLIPQWYGRVVFENFTSSDNLSSLYNYYGREVEIEFIASPPNVPKSLNATVLIGIIVGGSIGFVVIILFVIFGMMFLVRKYKRKYEVINYKKSKEKHLSRKNREAERVWKKDV